VVASSQNQIRWFLTVNGTKESYRDYTISVSLRFAQNDAGRRTAIVEVWVNDKSERRAMILAASQKFQVESEANDFGLKVGERWVDEQWAFTGRASV
jgi:hypothetical protein